MDHSGMDMGGMDMGGSGDVPGMGGHGMAGMKMYVHGSIGEDVLWFASWQPTSAGATVGVCIGLFLLAILDRWLHALQRACSASWNKGRIFALPVASGPLPSSATTSSTQEITATRRNAKSASTSGTPSLSEKNQPPAPQACQCGCGGECGSSSATAAACCGDECAPSVPEYEARDPALLAEEGYLPLAVRDVDARRPERWSRPFRLSVDVPRGLLQALTTLVHFLLMLTVMTYQLWWMISVIVGVGVGEAMFGRFGASRV